MDDPHWTLMLHGGAGRVTRETIPAAADAAARAGLAAALEAGSAVLARGGAAIDAVEAAVRVLEDDPAFNAGRGAALTIDGGVSLDAAIMDGRDRSAGAVAGVSATRHPVSLARAVIASPHVFLSGEGADAFSRERGLEQATSDWFVTDERRAHLRDMLARNADAYDVDMKYGTVGAVALDRHGNLAAATSTGGVTGKRWGRIGDSPVPGAGTWADRTCAISCTGSGEFFLRVAAAHQVATRMRFGGAALEPAVSATLDEVAALGGTGGMIAIEPGGTAIWRFSTPGMNRALATSGGERRVALYGDEG